MPKRVRLGCDSKCIYKLIWLYYFEDYMKYRVIFLIMLLVSFKGLCAEPLEGLIKDNHDQYALSFTECFTKISLFRKMNIGKDEDFSIEPFQTASFLLAKIFNIDHESIAKKVMAITFDEIGVIKNEVDKDKKVKAYGLFREKSELETTECKNKIPFVEKINNYIVTHADNLVR